MSSIVQNFVKVKNMNTFLYMKKMLSARCSKCLMLSFFMFGLFFMSSAGYSEVSGTASVIIIGGDAKYPPYEFLDDNSQPSGFSVELSEALARVMGLSVEIRLDSWDSMREALDSGKIQMLQGMSYSKERAEQFDFSPPYTLIQHSIFVRDGISSVMSLEDLKGKEVTVQRNGIMHDFLKSNETEIIPVPTGYQADALRQVASGKYDYAIVAHLPGLYFIREYGLSNVKPVGSPVAVQKYCYAVSKGNSELIARISEGLAILKKTGQFGKIHRKWIGVLEPGLSLTQVLRIGGGIFLILVLLILGSLFWSKTLKTQVALRTKELETRQKQLIQADKMASLGYLVSGIAHELNNPNGLMLLNLPVLIDSYKDTEHILEEYFKTEGDFEMGGLKYSRMRQEIPHILTETKVASEQIRSIVEGLKDFGRQSDDDQREPVSLNTLVDHALRLVRKTVEDSTTNFSVEYSDTLPEIEVNSQRVEQVVVNLILNACQALKNKKDGIFVSTLFDSAAQQVTLIIHDEGYGISEENLPHLTDPFFTTRRTSGGTGLGLSVSAGIVKAQRGSLVFESTSGSGTTVKLSFPAAI